MLCIRVWFSGGLVIGTCFGTHRRENVDVRGVSRFYEWNELELVTGMEIRRST